MTILFGLVVLGEIIRISSYLETGSNAHYATIKIPGDLQNSEAAINLVENATSQMKLCLPISHDATVQP